MRRNSKQQCAFSVKVSAICKIGIRGDDYDYATAGSSNIKIRCTVDYDPGVGKHRQDLWSKQWKSAEEYDKTENRKQVVQTTVLSSIVARPVRLASYTPERLFNILV